VAAAFFIFHAGPFAWKQRQSEAMTRRAFAVRAPDDGSASFAIRIAAGGVISRWHGDASAEA
jgi:hypothetical protein